MASLVKHRRSGMSFFGVDDISFISKQQLCLNTSTKHAVLTEFFALRYQVNHVIRLDFYYLIGFF